MTSRELMRLILRRWYVIVVGAVLTVAIVWPVTHRPGVYWTQMNVVLLPPTYQYFPNKLEDPHYSLSALAGLIVRDFNGQHRSLMTASGETTLFGLGQLTGSEVKQPNMGNQWQPLFPNAAIDVQVVESSPDAVDAQARNIITELDHLLTKRQDDLGVASTMRATLIASPAEPSVYYISGSRTRALAVGALVGTIITVLAAYWFDRWVRRRQRRSRQARTSIFGGARKLVTPGLPSH